MERRLAEHHQDVSPALVERIVERVVEGFKRTVKELSS